MKFIITTTSTLAGFDILDYLGTVSAHVVTGTGMFSDIAASFSDIFGGRSNSYQKQLISIKEEVLSRLKKEAMSLGANCILGMNLDFDEISGKGKTMFMVTAIGTAVKVSKTNNVEDKFVEEIADEYVCSEKVIRDIHRNSYLTLANEKRLSLTSESNWKSIIELKLTELLPFICEQAEIIIGSKTLTSDSISTFETYFTTFFSQLPEATAIEYIYELAEKAKIKDFVIGVIKELDLLDFSRVTELLKSEILENKKTAIEILYLEKPLYSKEDFTKIDKIVELLDCKFSELGTRYEKKSLLSTKVHDLWKCTCGYGNTNEGEYCYGCGKNIYGFSESEIKPGDVKKYLLAKKTIIKKYLDNSETLMEL